MATEKMIDPQEHEDKFATLHLEQTITAFFRAKAGTTDADITAYLGTKEFELGLTVAVNDMLAEKFGPKGHK